MKNVMDFTGKKYFVTGASSGMGRSTAICLAQQGAQVVINGRSRERLEETLEQMPGNGHQILEADIGQMEDLTPLFRTMMADGKKLDGMVHCAGIATILPLNMIKRSNLEECMGVNLYAFLDMVRLFAKRKYHEEKGSIVGVSSIVVKHPAKCQTVYAASKGAMNAAVQALAIELADKQIRINCIMPASTNTAMMQGALNSMPDAVMKRKMEEQLLGITEPDEIAQYILFLLSDAASAVTGREFYADGGLLG
jgi:NAD(P)-dependent dehydrogenase (short-subunit alcohol dehydrogenase family)